MATEKQIVITSRIIDDDDFIKLCLEKLYEQQEDDEQSLTAVLHENGRGFTKADGTLLSELAESMINGVELTKFDIRVLRLRLPKYSKQLTILLTDQEVGL